MRQAHSSFELSHESSIEMGFPSLANNHTPPSAHRCSCSSCHNNWARTHNLNLVPPIRGTIMPAQEETTAHIIEVEEEQEHHPASPKSPKMVTHENPKENVSDSDSVNQVDVVKEKGKLKRTRKEGGEDEGASPSPRLSKREPRSHASATSPPRSENYSASYCRPSSPTTIAQVKKIKQARGTDLAASLRK
ncbi:hypothetical protein CPB84DRAFT_1799056 [Gymnopilus junonius]|uniref:Uncharacterized protein n=1 Tax=Gymnopilus junonius TaxID=109634 RepID=A0A9P5NAU3_GYMJU|nr:hypothetical protein CPB84DRAFT_1799056 [Gymnopilus junonius]